MKHLFSLSFSLMSSLLLAFALTVFACSQQADQHQVESKSAESKNAWPAKPMLTHAPQESSQNSASARFPEAADSSPVIPVSVSLPTVNSELQSTVKNVRLETKLYVSKEGSLFGDFTVLNTNRVPVSELWIECSEYDSMLSLLKKSKQVLSHQQWIAPQAQEQFDQVEFGYVHDELYTASCQVHSAEARGVSMSHS